MKIAVVSPHRDDAAFSLGLAIGAWLEAGHVVTVVNCFTRSEYAPYADFEFIHSNDRLPRVTALRLREDQSWRKMYEGKLDAVDLNLKDAPLRLHLAVNQVLTAAANPDDKAMAKLPKAVAALKVDAVVLPLALGSHVDHVTAREAMRAALPAEMPVSFYEDLPYAAWPEMATTIPDAAAALHQELTPLFVTHGDTVERAVERKRRLALCYDSQIPDATATLIAEFCVPYGGRERVWSNAPWQALTLMTPGDVP